MPRPPRIDFPDAVFDGDRCESPPTGRPTGDIAGLWICCEKTAEQEDKVQNVSLTLPRLKP